VVMVTPALRRLRNAYPGARLTFIGQPFAWELLHSGDLVDEVLVYDKRGEDSGNAGFLRLAHRMRPKDFDAAFIFHRSFGSALAALLARAPVRVGYRHEMRDSLLTHPVREHEVPSHIILENLELLDAVGIRGDETPVEIAVDTTHEAAYIIQLGARLEGKPVVVICPNGGWPTKTWRSQHINQFLDMYGVGEVTFVLVGVSGDERFASEIYSVNNDVLNLVGRTTIRELVYILRRADVVVAPDTSTVHLATAVGTPVVALFGPTSSDRCGPQEGSKSSVLYGKVNCLKCYHKKCTKDPFCMDTIAPEEVKAEVDRYLALRGFSAPKE
jgi:lipopolysaccharide heptosyltransferase II